MGYLKAARITAVGNTATMAFSPSLLANGRQSARSCCVALLVLNDDLCRPR